MEKGSFIELVSYFETLARQHVLIKHTDSKKHFFRFEINEALTSLPSGMNYPCMIMEESSITISDRRSDNPQKVRECGFMLAGHVSDPGDFNFIHNLWDTLESIGDDIIARIRYDKRNYPSTPVRNLDMESIEATFFSSARFPNLYGVHYSFKVESFFPSDMRHDRWKIDED